MSEQSKEQEKSCESTSLTGTYCEMSDKTYKCSTCGKTYRKPKIPISCTVMHPEGQCCHYGEKEEQSKEVESGYEQEQRKLFNLIYDISRSEVIGELLNEAIQLALKEGERRAREEKDYPCRVCEHKDIAYENGKRQGREEAIEKVKEIVESKEVEKFEYPNEGGCTTCRDFVSKEDLLTELNKIKEPKGEGKR
jgi:hypothetical protein